MSNVCFIKKNMALKIKNVKMISWYLRAIQHQRCSGSGGDAKIDIDVKVVDEYKPPESTSPIDRLTQILKKLKEI